MLLILNLSFYVCKFLTESEKFSSAIFNGAVLEIYYRPQTPVTTGALDLLHKIQLPKPLDNVFNVKVV